MILCGVLFIGCGETYKMSFLATAGEYYDKNFTKWQTLGHYVWPNPDEIVAITTWTGQINFMREWLFNKLDYMKKIYCE